MQPLLPPPPQQGSPPPPSLDGVVYAGHAGQRHGSSPLRPQPAAAGSRGPSEEHQELKSQLQKKKERFFSEALQQPLLLEDPSVNDSPTAVGIGEPPVKPAPGGDDLLLDPDEYKPAEDGPPTRPRAGTLSVPVFVESAGARRPQSLRFRLKVKRLTTNVPLQAGLVLCLIADVIMGLTILGIENSSETLRVFMVVFALLYFIELVVLRLISNNGWEYFVMTTVPYTRKFCFLLTMIILAVGFVFECVYFQVDPWIDHGCDSEIDTSLLYATRPQLEADALAQQLRGQQQRACDEWHKKLMTLTAYRVLRWVIVLADKILLTARISENIVSQCRRRYIAGGWDIDLTYVSDRIVATSWPSVPSVDYFESLYRNRIVNVAKFFDSKHPNHYKVYNMCAERNYDGAYFHDRVERIPIDDHQPCDIEMIHQFCVSADQYLQEDSRNIVVAHCKGGKGRTGMMICSYLVWSGEEPDWEAARKRFGRMRTEHGSPKEQTVESPSQNLFGRYFTSCLTWKGTGRARRCFYHPPLEKRLTIRNAVIGPIPKSLAGKIPDIVAGLVQGTSQKVLWCSREAQFEYVDPLSPTKGQRITCRDFASAAAAGGSRKEKVVVRIHESGRTEDHEMSPAEFGTWWAAHRKGPYPEVYLHYDLSGIPPISGNIRFHLTMDGTTWALSLLWCWFHTSFVDPEVGHTLIQPHVDGAHKDHDNIIFAPKFSMRLSFDPPPNGVSL